ncbi:MAG: SUMF1/EgtB/PvdO family nonheme iron enzyme [Gammaproteobacteria bacterium]|nr:SUMF1/EgtB/PvdO family nonheme iron enzyme [Gammaproteobacteria bacterium]
MSGDREDVIQPAEYRPPSFGSNGQPGRSLRPSPALLVIAAVLLVLLPIAWFLLTARAVAITVTPEPDSLDVSGGIAIKLGNRHLLRSGEYRIDARKEGYRPLDAALVVTDDSREATFTLDKLPGRLKLVSTPVAAISVDGKPYGNTPQEALELPAGRHQLSLSAARHQPQQIDIDIEGLGKLQELSVELKPGWAPITVSSRPAGAEVSIAGQPQGTTPARLELGAGAVELEFRLPGYKPRRLPVLVVANQPQTLPEVLLESADATVQLSSTPAGASVTVDGAFRGRTPLSLNLSPGATHKLLLSRDGHENAEASLSLAADERKTLALSLKPILGVLRLSLTPADARLSIDGEVRPLGDGRLELSATTHRIEVSKPGYRPYGSDITVRRGVDQKLDVVLGSEAELKAAANPALISSATLGLRLRKIAPGSFTMGTARSDQGRQANEVQRAVRLTRPFYLATTEITNAQYRQFRSGHSSGIVLRVSLDNEGHPAVRVSWNDAVAFCNWLSGKDGLPAAYNADGSLVQPLTTGYRLPTEAEWEWAARFHGDGAPRRYPWGNAMPPPPDSGNFADAKAATLVNQVLDGYDDGYAATAPVGKGLAIAPGLYDLGGNVSEWVHDRYDGALVPSLNAANDPFGPASGAEHVVRGASWRHGRITELRLAWRDHAGEPRDDLGFRVARYVE